MPMAPGFFIGGIVARSRTGTTAAPVAGAKRTEMKEQFVQHYLQHGNAAEAYRHAYPGSRKWKSKTACSGQGWKLLNYDDWVRDRLAELQKKAEDKSVTSAVAVLNEASRVAFSDIRKLFDADGNLIPLHLLDNDTAAFVAGVDVVTLAGDDAPIQVRKIRLWSKVDALEKLFKHLGLYERDNLQKERLVIVKDFTGNDGEET